jgi:hypothetical protein
MHLMPRSHHASTYASHQSRLALAQIHPSPQIETISTAPILYSENKVKFKTNRIKNTKPAENTNVTNKQGNKNKEYETYLYQLTKIHGLLHQGRRRPHSHPDPD